MTCQKHETELIKAKVKLTYSWIDDAKISDCYDKAMSDYIALRYPTDADKPLPEKVKLDYHTSNWIYKRMNDILERAGASLSSYKENNLNMTYGASYIDPYLASQIKPKASVPK